MWRLRSARLAVVVMKVGPPPQQWLRVMYLTLFGGDSQSRMFSVESGSFPKYMSLLGINSSRKLWPQRRCLWFLMQSSMAFRANSNESSESECFGTDWPWPRVGHGEGLSSNAQKAVRWFMLASLCGWPSETKRLQKAQKKKKRLSTQTLMEQKQDKVRKHGPFQAQIDEITNQRKKETNLPNGA